MGFQLCACGAQTFVPLPSKLSGLTHDSPLPLLTCTPGEVTDKFHQVIKEQLYPDRSNFLDSPDALAQPLLFTPGTHSQSQASECDMGA